MELLEHDDALGLPHLHDGASLRWVSPGSSAAAGFTVSLAPMTRTTSVSGSSSISSTMWSGTLASANRTFISAGEPTSDRADGEPHLLGPPLARSRSVEFGDLVLGNAGTSPRKVALLT